MGKLEQVTFEDLEVDAAPGRLFRAWMDIQVGLSKVMKDTFSESRCIEGDHRLEGGVVELVYPSGTPALTKKCTKSCAKDVFRYTQVDYEKNVCAYQFLEGEVAGLCKSFSGCLEIVASGVHAGKSVVKHRVEYEVVDETQPHDTAMQQVVAFNLFKKIELYLKAKEAEYVDASFQPAGSAQQDI